MKVIRRWFETRWASLSATASRGATFVEYALITSLLLVGSIAAVDALEAASDEEIDNQADCIATRPPPPECQLSPVPVEVSVPDPGFLPPTSAPPVADLLPRLTSTGPVVQGVPGSWSVELPVVLSEAPDLEFNIPGPPIPDVLLRSKIQFRDPANPGAWLPVEFFAECITEIEGGCTLVHSVPYSDVDLVKITIVAVESDPAPEASTIPGPFIVEEP